MSESDGEQPPEDALSEGPPTGHDETAESAEDIDFDEALSGLQDIESSRRTKGVIMGVSALVLLGLSLYAIYEFRTFLFRPDLPIEERERELIDKTDDPQCRSMIAEVADIRERFFALEPIIEEIVPGGEPDRRRRVADRLDKLVTKLDEAESLSHRANFRYDHSASEVDGWFRYTRGQLVEVREFVAPDGPTGDAGVDAGTADVSGPDVGADADETAPDAGRKESIGSQRNTLLFNTHNSFEKFRVWHSSERFAHPCGDAEEMETPWRPSGPDAGTGVKAPDAAGGSPTMDRENRE